MKDFRKLRGPIAACIVLGAGAAYAQEAPRSEPQPTTTQPCGPDVAPADCPSGQSQPTTAAPQTTMPAPQPAPPAPPAPTTYQTNVYEPPATPMAAETRPWYETVGYGISIGGGVDDFVGDNARATTKVGGGWDVRLTIGTKQWLAGEISYIGSAQAIDALGLDSSAVLVGNGVQGALRVNFARNEFVQPFLYGGGAWRRYDLTNESFNTSDVANKDDVFEIPVGVGVAGYLSGFMADLRGEYRGVWGNDLISTPRSNDNTIVGPLDRWAVKANIGTEF